LPVAGGLRFASLSKGDIGQHRCGITSTGSAYCWGSNFDGQLGNGSGGSQLTGPTPSEVLGGAVYTRIAIGGKHTCALKEGGLAYCWGHGREGELGDGTATSSRVPVPVAGGLTFTDLALGDHYSCGIATAGGAYCWGNNWDGKVGTGVLPDFDSPDRDIFIAEPSLVVGGQTFSSIDASWFHTCALTVEGAAYCWGSNEFGQMGDGTFGSDHAPNAVLGPPIAR